MKYADDDYLKNKERILTALDEINRVQAQYRDVVAILDVITLHDIADYRVETDIGIKTVGAMYAQQDIKHILQVFADTTCLTREKFESIVVSHLPQENP